MCTETSNLCFQSDVFYEVLRKRMYRSHSSNCFLQHFSCEGQLNCVIALFQGSSLMLIELIEVESF